LKELKELKELEEFEVFEMRGKLLTLKKNVGETPDELYYRALFILNNINDDNCDKKLFEILIDKSFLFINVFIRKNTYNNKIIKKLKEKYNCNIY
jgi:hypothetical protein